MRATLVSWLVEIHVTIIYLPVPENSAKHMMQCSSFIGPLETGARNVAYCSETTRYDFEPFQCWRDAIATVWPGRLLDSIKIGEQFVACNHFRAHCAQQQDPTRCHLIVSCICRQAKDLLQLMCYTGDASILVQMEEQVLKVLDFQVQVADPVFFLNRLLLYDEHGDSQEVRLSNLPRILFFFLIFTRHLSS